MKKYLFSALISVIVVASVFTTKESEAQMLGAYCCNQAGYIVCSLNNGSAPVGVPCVCYGVSGTGYVCR